MELNLITLNIIICIVLVVSCWVVWFFVEPDSLKISTKDIVALIATALIVLVVCLPFLTPETVKKTDYTSFTITEGVDNTITVTGVDGDLKNSEFTFNSRLNLKKTKKITGQLKLELLEKDSDGKETLPSILVEQGYNDLRNEIINSSDFGKKYVVTYQKKRVVYKTNWEFFLQLLKKKQAPETDTEEFITLTIKPKISVENK